MSSNDNPSEETSRERVACVECGKDLTDPKNSGDQDINGEWVCSDSTCRIMHETAMTVHRTVLRTEGEEPRGVQYER